MPRQIVDLASADQFSDPVELRLESHHPIVAARWGAGSATVTLQIRFAEDGDWIDLSSLAGTGAAGDKIVGPCDLRIGIKAGDHSSGTVTAALLVGESI